ncbi:hypothetical protein NONO_c24690 [Nocardia nova SH22a]|uniref:Uncharacterized protein n=1 Tax=Nocardia nova SH22a TaxID=1415166 RepID=W5TD49_9NOCA|nr:hypothetical protein [Nocardia nova]AHH17265.1 hypothetical protein NONO_c24690 [Nocardia nova SH22a]
MSGRTLVVRLDVTGLGDRDVAEVLSQLEAAGFTIRITRTARTEVPGVGPIVATTAALWTVTDAGRSS